MNEGMQGSLFEETKGAEATATSTNNPFRMLHKKDKEPQQTVGSNLDVKRVKYSYKQTSPGGGEEKYSPEQEDLKREAAARQSNTTTSPFQPAASSSGKDNVRGSKASRRAGPQAERAR